MSSLPVLAEASSKLHADIAIIRLLRAGLTVDQISAVFPRERAPNTVCCWLGQFQPVELESTQPVVAAGLLGKLFQNSQGSEDFENQLEKLGLTSELTTRLIEKMEDGRIVLCVHARNETEAAVVWHVFEHVAAEHISSPADYVERSHHETPAHLHHLTGVAA